jgi:hypothetical protein
MIRRNESAVEIRQAEPTLALVGSRIMTTVTSVGRTDGTSRYVRA